MSALTQAELRYVPIESLLESQANVRKHHDEAKHLELVESIREHGILTPLVVRASGVKVDRYEVAAGHRRLRAATVAGVDVVPVSVRVMDDRTFHEVMLTENLQRLDPEPLDEADAYQAMIDELGYDVPTLAAKFGKSETYVRQRLVLTRLAPAGRDALNAGVIELGHAVLLARTTPEKQAELLERTLVSRALPPAQFRPDEVEELADEEYQPERQEGSRKVATDTARTLVSIGELRQIMAEKMQPLGCVKWDRDDATLVPAAGACASCPKRTGANPMLFEELDASDDRCPDAACYDSKRTEWLARRVASLREQMPNLVVISTKWSRPLRQFNGEAVLRKDKEWAATKAKTGITPALVVDADGADYNILEHWEKIGQVIDVKRITPQKKAKASTPKPSASSGGPKKLTPAQLVEHDRAKDLFVAAVAAVVDALIAAPTAVADRRDRLVEEVASEGDSCFIDYELRRALPFLPKPRRSNRYGKDGDVLKETSPLSSRQSIVVAAFLLAKVELPHVGGWMSGALQAIDPATGTYEIPQAFLTLGAEAGIDAAAVWSEAVASVPAPKKAAKAGAR
jgi:ParB/RepB/Spo0J family partition protein